MTAFDYAVIIVILLSAALGVWRGFIQEVFALGAWVTGLVAATLFGASVARWFGFEADPLLKLTAAYAVVFIGVFVSVSIVGLLVTKMVRAVGLSPVDRGLGAMFGVVRGALIVTVIVFIAGFSGLKQADWWQNSVSAKPFEMFANVLRHRLPDSVTKYLKTSTALDSKISAARKIHRDRAPLRRDFVRALDEAVFSTNPFSEVLLCVA